MILLWKCVTIAMMVVFFPAALLASIKGFQDVFHMFQDLNEGKGQSSENLSDNSM